MAQISWLNAVDGGFDTAADWSGGTVPGPSDDAILGDHFRDHGPGRLPAGVSGVITGATY